MLVEAQSKRYILIPNSNNNRTPRFLQNSAEEMTKYRLLPNNIP